jgi:alpha-1,6-mannosyltransferase
MQFNISFFKLYKTHLLLALSCFLFYSAFAYDLERTDYVKLVSLYVALFFLFYKIIQLTKHNLKLLTYLAFAFRAVFVIAIPNLSQDFYRFIWDGRIILEGYNPYLFTVESFISKGEFPITQAQELYNGMGTLNASHYSNYPPINQICFVIAGLFSGKNIIGSVVVMRLLIITADFGTLFYGKKLLEKLKLPAHNIFWYVLNPLIIIELTGNLHFEGVMIFFLVWSLYLLHSGKWKWAAVLLSLSISVKLIPLIFLPLLYQKLGWKKSFGFYLIVGLVTLLLFAPFYSSQFISNYSETVGLWFSNFEFNASLYYLVREIGYLFRGYNEIAIIGKYIAILVFLFVVGLAFLRRNKTMTQLITAMLLALSFYYFTATTVHPWYIATLLLLSVFTKYKFPLVWSFVIILSYLAYLQIGVADKSENLWIIGLEYLVVYGFLIWELFVKGRNKNKHYIKN